MIKRFVEYPTPRAGRWALGQSGKVKSHLSTLHNFVYFLGDSGAVGRALKRLGFERIKDFPKHRQFTVRGYWVKPRGRQKRIVIPCFDAPPTRFWGLFRDQQKSQPYSRLAF